MILMFALRLLLGLKMIGVKIKYLVILYIMENLILMSQDGLIPIENNLIMGGRMRRHHTIKGGAATLPKLMQNLQLFDESRIKKGGSIQTKPNRKPVKFII